VVGNDIPRRFDSAIALITGGTSGIGFATAERLIAEGATVVIAGRNTDQGAAAVQRLGPRCAFIATDVTRRDQVESLVHRIEQDHGRLDVVVNAAGTVLVRPLTTTREHQWDDIIATNLTSLFHVCQATLPLLEATASQAAASPGAVAGGATTAIVTVASLNGVAGDPGMTAYGAAKAGAINFTRSLALETIKRGVRVNSVSPGAVDTPMTVTTAGVPANAETFRAAIPAGRFGQPAEIAAAVAFVASRDASFMVGANLTVDGGVTAASGHPDMLTMFGMTS